MGVPLIGLPRLRQMADSTARVEKELSIMAKAPTPAATAKPAAKKTVVKTTAAKTAAKKPAPRAKASSAVKPTRLKAESTVESLKGQASNFASQAGDKAKDYATAGKDKATEALDGLSGFVDDLAKSVDEKFGKQYGDYTRKAATAVSGVADTLKTKQIDDLVEDTRKFVREKPAVAIGAAAAVGFFLTRLFRAGSDRDA